jgi:exodeoxyribonuclease VII large subunit
MEKEVLNISELNEYLKDLIDSDYYLHDIFLQGEITNLRHYKLGQQIYFNLTDGQSQINCVLFSSFQKLIKTELKDGLKVIVRGKINFYKKKGSLTFQVAYIIPQGEGLLSKGFEALKKKLQNEGLFDEAKKKPIPQLPNSVALVTAYDSAAMWDFVSIIKEQAPHIKIFLVPAVMQGVKSVFSLVKAIDIAEEYKNPPELIVIARGGGSAEDLNSFNDELLVRRISACGIPVISAIGHEIDYTLADFVSDFRVPTPTAAAQTLAKHSLEIKQRLASSMSIINFAMDSKLSCMKKDVDSLLISSLKNIKSRFQGLRLSMDYINRRLDVANPMHKFDQGYSICRLADSNKIIRSVNQVKSGTKTITELKDGKFNSFVC